MAITHDALDFTVQGTSWPPGYSNLFNYDLTAQGYPHQECSFRVPTRTAKTGKPGKMGRNFPVREKSGNFEPTGKVREKSGKITQNMGKVREFQKNFTCYF